MSSVNDKGESLWGEMREGNEADNAPSSTVKTEEACFKKPMFGTRPHFKKPDKINVFDNTTSDKKVINSTEKPVNKAVEKKKESKTKKPSLSPAELVKQSETHIPYKEPAWGGISEKEYSLDILKNGVIVDNIKLSEKSYLVVGRLPSCDITMDHPSLSRYHAVLQHCSKPSSTYVSGWYLYDLDSTHGTWVNKIKVTPLNYVHIRVGHVVKFGGSTRLNILQGPPDDQDDESELSITEMKEIRDKQKRELEILKLAEQSQLEEKQRQLEKAEADTGCSWGMDEAEPSKEDEEPSEENPFALEQAEELYIHDPKKALNGFFEREGLELPEYMFDDSDTSKRTVSVELPIDDANGRPIVAEVTVSGKKKDAVIACALEACRVLDRHGVLRAATHESRKRKKKNWEDEDFYDSDEDTFLDRTGTIEQKRVNRMKKAGKDVKNVETYESIVSKLEAVQRQIHEFQMKLDKAKAEESATDMDELDALDAYMSQIKSGAMDTRTKMKIKRDIFDLRKEEQKMLQLAKIAKPANMPELKKYIPQAPPTAEQTNTAIEVNDEQPVKPAVQSIVPVLKPGQSLVGRIKKPSVKGPVLRRPIIGPEMPSTDTQVDEVEEEDDNDESCDNKPEPSTEVVTTDNKDVVAIDTIVSDAVVMDTVVMETESSEKMARKQEAEDKQSLEIEKHSTNTNTDLSDIKKRKKPPKNPKKSKMVESTNEAYDPNVPEYVGWLPPDAQSGDGTTHLNLKYGY